MEKIIASLSTLITPRAKFPLTLPPNLFCCNVKVAALTSMTSSAGKMPMFDNVLKKASLFWGCNVCENAQNSFRKFTYKKTETNKAPWNKEQEDNLEQYDE